jgi:hypothetical protein
VLFFSPAQTSLHDNNGAGRRPRKRRQTTALGDVVKLTPERIIASRPIHRRWHVSHAPMNLWRLRERVVWRVTGYRARVRLPSRTYPRRGVSCPTRTIYCTRRMWYFFFEISLYVSLGVPFFPFFFSLLISPLLFDRRFIRTSSSGKLLSGHAAEMNVRVSHILFHVILIPSLLLPYTVGDNGVRTRCVQ